MDYVTASDLTVIQGLMRHLDANFRRQSNIDVDAEVHLSDSNGESLGTVKWHEDRHIWEFPEEDA